MTPIALCCGDPAGIGPEVTLKAAQALGHDIPLVWVGDPHAIPRGMEWRFAPDDCNITPGAVLHVRPHIFEHTVTPGTADARHAPTVMAILDDVTNLCLSQTVAGMVTGPISKKLLQDGGGFAFPGHTEYLAHWAGCDRVVMMLACDQLRVVPLTIHVPLCDVPAMVTQDAIIDTVHILTQTLQSQFGLKSPRIAVAGLNPHASEGGNIGRDDIDVVAPAIATLQGQGHDITGPLPADTMFHAAARATYDVALCMYHDQALIPIKTLDFAGGINVTLGLPFVRTSPDHGTAFDIAGQGAADPTSTIQAVKMAWEMAQQTNAD